MQFIYFSLRPKMAYYYFHTWSALGLLHFLNELISIIKITIKFVLHYLDSERRPDDIEKAPVPIKNWEGILNGSKEKNDCIQFSMFSYQIVGSENCLYMNIHVPEIPSKITDPKAVVVLIHGGSLAWGSGSERVHGSPEFIIHQDVIYITINYRLHVLGFLNLNIPECPGNMGAKDIVMALKWIRNDISSFGGDPENVTLIGSSCGSIIIHTLMLSPLSRGLFHKVIMMGMYAFHPFIVFEEDPLTVAIDFARECGFCGSNASELLDFYCNLPLGTVLEKLRDINDIMQEKYKKVNPSSPFSLTIERIERGAFMPKSPADLMKSMYTVPIIYGVCEIENIFAVHPTYSKFIKQDLRTIYRQNIHSWLHKLDDDTMKIIERKIRNRYKEDTMNETEMIFSAITTQQDLIVLDFYDTVANIIHKNSPSKPIYVYQFEYQGELNEMSNTFKALLPFYVKDTCHSDDFFYWMYRKTIPNPQDSKIVEIFTKLFTNFAKTGNPNCEEIRTEWKNTTPDSQHYLKINTQLKLCSGRPNRGKMAFWEKIKATYSREHKNS